MADTVEEALELNAMGPAEASGDQGRMRQHSLKDQVEADMYLQAKAVAKSGKFGIRMKQITPGAAV